MIKALKMKNYSFCIFGFIIFISCTTNSTPKQIGTNDTSPTLNNRSDTCEGFFNKFPTTFEDFNRLYGYDETKGEGLLYKSYEKEINYFFSCTGIADSVKLQKCINICKTGAWDADAVSMFQYYTLQMVGRNPNLAVNILRQLPDKEISGFWHFLFDGPHPADSAVQRSFESLYKEIKSFDTAMAEIMKGEYSKLKKSDDHGH